MAGPAGPGAGPPAGSRPGSVPRTSAAGILIASFNPGKARELGRLVEAIGLAPLTLSETGISAPYEECGTTYEENALGKARHYAALSGLVAVADDSGIEVEALDWRPGPMSARYGGAGVDDPGRCRLLLEDLAGVPDERRAARYVAVAVIARPDGEARAFHGACEGRITSAMRGGGGFGYDPLFFYPPFGATFAEVSAERKHQVSHRGVAFAALGRFLASDDGRAFLAAMTRTGS